MQIWSSSYWPNFRHDPKRTEALLARFMVRFGAVKGMYAGLAPNERSNLFQRTTTEEALSSFAIEGSRLNATELETSVVTFLACRQTTPQRHSDAIAELMLEAKEGQGCLTHGKLFHWHRLLFHGIEIQDKGQYRSFPKEISRDPAGSGENDRYVALPAEQIQQEMEHFLDWLDQDTTPAPIQAAIAYLWFDSIHPFSEGNGWIGRAIIEHVFAAHGGLPFSLSRQIEKDKRGYYAALEAGRVEGDGCIDATPFVLWLLERLEAGIEEASREAEFLVRRNAYFVQFKDLHPRGAVVLRKLFAEGQTRVEQGVSAGPYAKMANVSSATATRDLNELEGQGAITKAESGGRSTYYRLNW